MVSLPALSCPGELNSRLSSDTKLMSNWLPYNTNVLSRSLVKVLGLYGFMLNLSPRLTFLSLFEVPLMIAAEKVYNARRQVCVDAGASPGKTASQGLYANVCVFERGVGGKGEIFRC